jgi:hypothetical protein
MALRSPPMPEPMASPLGDDVRVEHRGRARVALPMTAPMDGRRRRWFAVDVLVAHSNTGTRIQEEFGPAGLAVWVCLLAAGKRSPVEGRVSFTSESEAWQILGILEPDRLGFTLEEFLDTLGRLKQTRRTPKKTDGTRRGRVTNVEITRWGRWQKRRSDHTNASQKPSGNEADADPDSDSDTHSDNDTHTRLLREWARITNTEPTAAWLKPRRKAARDFIDQHPDYGESSLIEFLQWAHGQGVAEPGGWPSWWASWPGSQQKPLPDCDRCDNARWIWVDASNQRTTEGHPDARRAPCSKCSDEEALRAS